MIRLTESVVLVLWLLAGSVAPADECLTIPTVTLHNGVEMPVLSLGTCHLVNVPNLQSHLPPDFVGILPEKTYRQMELALQRGFRSFDTAYIYRSQQPMAAVLGEWWRTGMLQSRQELWITSKIFHADARAMTFQISHMPELHNMTPEEVSKETRRHFEESLLELGLGYIDLMLLHWPSGKGLGDPILNRQRRLEAWKVLEDMYKRGWARAIGVSNFSPVHLEQLKEDGADIVPMVNQFEASVTLQYPHILKYCKENGIVPQAYSPLGRGTSEIPQAVANVGAKHEKDIGQVSFRYLYQLGYAVTFLTTSEERMVSNTDIFDFELSDEEMQELSALNRPDGGWGLPSPDELD